MGPKLEQAGDARPGPPDREVFERLADEHDENHFGRDEEPRRRAGLARSDPEGGHGREANGQVGGDLAVQQADQRGRVGWKAADERQQHGEIEIEDRSHGARHVGDQARSHGKREQEVTPVRIMEEREHQWTACSKVW